MGEKAAGTGVNVAEVRQGTVRTEEKRTGRQLAGMMILMLVFLAVFFLTYRTEVKDLISGPVTLTLSSLHKKAEEFEVTLSKDVPVFSETFICTLPDVETISLRVSDTGGDCRTGILRVLLQEGEDTSKQDGSQRTLAEQIFELSSLDAGVLQLKIPEGSQTKDHDLTLVIRMETDGSMTDADPQVSFTANSRQGLVSSVNGDPRGRSNVISEITYSNGQCLKMYYLVVCLMLILFMIIGYWLLFIRGWQLSKAYVPLALLLGAVFTLVLPVYTVPDENIHMDNAYKYADRILRTDETGIPGTIFMRTCDVLQADLMANTLESNHYWQMMNHFMDRPDKDMKELVPVVYFDSGIMVPSINYLPCSLGISLGRSMDLSALATYTLGRLCNLMAFVFLVWLSIAMLPYGKNAAAMLMLLPIAIQQGNSASYDAVTNGMILLFIACCLRLCRYYSGESDEADGRNRQERRVRHPGWGFKEAAAVVLCAFLVLYLARTKGGAYLPLCLLLICAVILALRKGKKETYSRYGREENGKVHSDGGFVKVFWILGVLLLLGAGVAIFASVFWKFISPMLTGNFQVQDGQGYSVIWLITHPMDLICKYWYTFQHSGANYLRGLMGGTLSWLDINVNRLYPIMFLGGTILLSHTEKDRFTGGKLLRAGLLLSGILSILLVMFSMLVAYTSKGTAYISGVQGRYFLCFAIVLFLGCSTDMISVSKENASKVAMVMMGVEILTVVSLMGKV